MNRAEKKRKVEADLAKVAPGQRHKSEDAAYFTLLGGPHHGHRLRLYAPWDAIRFKEGAEYELHPPISAKDEWIYIHTEEGNNEQ